MSYTIHADGKITENNTFVAQVSLNTENGIRTARYWRWNKYADAPELYGNPVNVTRDWNREGAAQIIMDKLAKANS